MSLMIDGELKYPIYLEILYIYLFSAIDIDQWKKRGIEAGPVEGGGEDLQWVMIDEKIL